MRQSRLILNVIVVVVDRCSGLKDPDFRGGYVKTDIIGKTLSSNQYGDFVVCDVEDSRNVVIKFLNTGFITKAKMSSVVDGAVKDKLYPSVCGVGVTGNKYLTWLNGRSLPEYVVWKGMIERCYSEKFHKKQPSYLGCTVSENFKSYEYFYEWMNKCEYYESGWELDKDLLIRGNKIYSEDTCIFLPKEVNTFLTNRNRFRGENPVGVCQKAGQSSFYAYVSIFGEIKHLGSFSTKECAFSAYKVAKEYQAKLLAEKYKEVIDPRAYEALLNYKVEITD